MIWDTVANLSQYRGLSDQLDAALSWFDSTNLAGLQEGELKIDPPYNSDDDIVCLSPAGPRAEIVLQVAV